MSEPRVEQTSVFVGRTTGAATRICFGRADHRRSVRGGALHFFGPGQVVGYLISGERAHRCYVFRTGRGNDQMSQHDARLVGVTPEVRLLASVRGRSGCGRLVRVLKAVERAKVPAPLLSDTFLLRATAARERYLALDQTVLGLLRDELQTTEWQDLRNARRRALPRLQTVRTLENEGQPSSGVTDADR